jgi:putative ABC transport system permease protein
MKIYDLISMARQNLWRTRLRTSLTLIGVFIGIAALISMVSFGIGLEENITNRFKNNDLFTSLTISNKAINFNARQRHNRISKEENSSRIPLNDSLIEVLQSRAEVNIAYPKINIQVRSLLASGKDTASTTTGSLPMAMAHHAPYNELIAGRYFSNDSALEALVSVQALTAMGYDARTAEAWDNNKENDSSLIPVLIDTMIGKELVLLSTSILSTAPLAFLGGIENVIGEEETRVKIVGILKDEQFSGPSLREEIILPIATAKSLPSLGFDRVSDLMSKKNNGDQYVSIFVKAKSMDDLSTLKKYLNEHNIDYFAIDDGLSDMKKSFIVLDSILGIIGLISLLVAGFGIVNTMLMSIMERKREIGIMKAVGGRNKDIRLIFFIEAGFIGLVGSFGGILLGFCLTRIANMVVNKQYIKNPSEYVDLFSFPVWLIVGAVVFSISISLLAGLYPAIRASNIHPIDALRQEG